MTFFCCHASRLSFSSPLCGGTQLSGRPVTERTICPTQAHLGPAVGGRFVPVSRALHARGSLHTHQQQGNRHRGVTGSEVDIVSGGATLKVSNIGA